MALRTRYAQGIRSGRVLRYQQRLFEALEQRRLDDALDAFDQAVREFRAALGE